MKRLLLWSLLALLAPFPSEAQKFAIKDVTKEELQNLTYDKDSTAEAVILHDVGKLRGDNFEFTRQLRVKILKKSGMDWGNWVFNLPSRGNFKVITYNLENGEIIREKATPKTIYSEEVVEGYFVFKVFAPNVRVGSIIDISYTHSGPPRQWWFQNRVPVVFSELVLEPTRVFAFNTTHFGFEPIQTVNEFTWRAQNMPAFRMEPYLNDYTNYITKFTVQLSSIGLVVPSWNQSFQFHYDVSTWKAVNNRLLELTRVQDALRGGGYLRDFVKSTKEKELGTMEKIQAAYDYVQLNLKWDDYKTIYPSATLRNKFVEGHTGNSADINMTLVALLNDLGVTTHPVALSTRDNGMVLPHAPNMDQLNYIVAYVKHEDVEMLIDATAPEGIMPGILPSYCINGSGLIVIANSENWIDLTPKQPSIKRQSIVINLDKAGEAKASLNNTYMGYGYLSWADELKEHNNDLERAKNKIQKENPDVTIIKYEIARNEPAKVSARETIELDVSEQLIDAGEEMLFNPFVLSDLDVNPFLSETRKYPVDMNFPKEVTSTVTVTLKGLAVKQLPESIRFALPDKSATFTYTAGATANSVQMKMTLKIERQIFTETEYQDLRRFYVEVVKKVGSMIEFTKI